MNKRGRKTLIAAACDRIRMQRELEGKAMGITAVCIPDDQRVGRNLRALFPGIYRIMQCAVCACKVQVTSLVRTGLTTGDVWRVVCTDEDCRKGCVRVSNKQEGGSNESANDHHAEE